MIEKYMKYKDMDPTTALAQQTREFAEGLYKEYKHQRELQEMEERIFQRLMKKFVVEVKNEASPAIKEIKEEIDKLFVSK